MRTRHAILLTVGLLALLAGVTYVVRLEQEREWDAELARLSPLLESEIRAFEARPRNRKPLFGEAIATTAWAEYLAARDQWEEWTNGDLREGWMDWFWSDEPEPIPDEIRERPPPLDGILAALFRAADARDAGRFTDLRIGTYGPPADADPVILFGSIDDLPWFAAALRLDAGDAAGAVDLLLLRDRMGFDLATDTTFFARMMGNRLRCDSMDQLAIWVARGRLPESEFGRLETLAETVVDAPPPGFAIVEPDWLAAQASYRRAASGEEEFFGFLDIFGTGARLAAGLIEPGRGDLLEAWRRLRALREEVEAGPPPDAAAWTAIGTRIRRETAASGNLVLRFQGDFMASVFSSAPVVHGQLRLAAEKLLLSVALARHVAEHGSPPGAIDAILPAKVRAAPQEGPWALWEDRETGGVFIGVGNQRAAEVREQEADRRVEEGLRNIIEALED